MRSRRRRHWTSRRWHHHSGTGSRDYVFAAALASNATRVKAVTASLIIMALAGLARCKRYGRIHQRLKGGAGLELTMLVWHLANRYLIRLGAAHWFGIDGLACLLVFFRSASARR